MRRVIAIGGGLMQSGSNCPRRAPPKLGMATVEQQPYSTPVHAGNALPCHVLHPGVASRIRPKRPAAASEV